MRLHPKAVSAREPSLVRLPIDIPVSPEIHARDAIQGIT
jgi:hypothetical protein